MLLEVRPCPPALGVVSERWPLTRHLVLRVWRTQVRLILYHHEVIRPLAVVVTLVAGLLLSR